MKTLITGGEVVTATGVNHTDVLVEDDKVAAWLAPGSDVGVTADRTIDATGKYVIPGGVDGHPGAWQSLIGCVHRLSGSAPRPGLPTSAVFSCKPP